MTHRFARHRVLGSLAGITLLVAIGAGCGSDDDSADTTAAAPQTTAAPAATEAPATEAPATEAPAATDTPAASAEGLVISDFAFSDFTGTAGVEFTITNKDGFGHTVTSDSFDVSVAGGATETLTIPDPGTYPIVCKIHPQMQGTITIE